MSKMDVNSKIDVTSECAPDQDGFQVVEWNLRPNSATENLDAELDNGCSCGCGIVDS